MKEIVVKQITSDDVVLDWQRILKSLNHKADGGLISTAEALLIFKRAFKRLKVKIEKTVYQYAVYLKGNVGPYLIHVFAFDEDDALKTAANSLKANGINNEIVKVERESRAIIYYKSKNDIY